MSNTYTAYLIKDNKLQMTINDFKGKYCCLERITIKNELITDKYEITSVDEDRKRIILKA